MATVPLSAEDLLDSSILVNSFPDLPPLSFTNRLEEYSWPGIDYQFPTSSEAELGGGVPVENSIVSIITHQIC